MGQRTKAAFTRRKAMALLAGGLVLGVGAGATTLAAWTDQESVWGGTGATADQGTGGLTTSLFNMQQSATGAAGSYVDSPTGTQLAFSTGASTLSPGTTVYAYVYLRTVTGSTAGTVTLSSADTSSADAALANVLTWGARYGGPQSGCNGDTFSTTGAQLVAPGTALTATIPTTARFPLDAGSTSAPGTATGVCFAVTMPAINTLTNNTSNLSGLRAAPLWHFNGVSN